VRGLTTAAVVWFTAMVGMASGAGMYVLAAGATAMHFIVVSGFPILTRRVPGTKWSPTYVCVTYVDGHGVLRAALSSLTASGFTVADLSVERTSAPDGHVEVSLVVHGKGSIEELVPSLSQITGVVKVDTDRETDTA
jgi:putative Mg2+ transporter-C (MgtC) family protein